MGPLNVVPGFAFRVVNSPGGPVEKTLIQSPGGLVLNMIQISGALGKQ